LGCSIPLLPCNEQAKEDEEDDHEIISLPNAADGDEIDNDFDEEAGVNELHNRKGTSALKR
jgi:hypothetical protein